MFSSRKIAKVFAKEHYNIFKIIKALDCSPEFTTVNFNVSEYNIGKVSIVHL